MPDKIIGEAEKPVESVTKSFWGNVWAKVTAGATAVITIGAIVIFTNLPGHKEPICIWHPSFPGDTTCVWDTTAAKLAVDSLNRESKLLYCTDVKDYSKVQYALADGILKATTGATETVKELDSESGKLVDVQKPVLATVQNELSTDSTEIVWVGPAQYEVRIKRDLPGGYWGSFPPDFARAFWVGNKRDAKGNETPSLAVLDYQTSRYYVGPLVAEEIIDPGFAASPVGAGVAVFRTTDTLASPWYGGGESHTWYFNDTTAGGVTADSSGSAHGTLKNGATLFPGFNSIASACSLDGVNDSINCGGLAIMNAPDSLTWSFRMKIKDTTLALGAVGGVRASASSGFYFLFRKPDTLQALVRGATGTNGQFKIQLIGMKNWNRYTLIYNGPGATDGAKVQLMFNGVGQTLAFSGTLPSVLDNMSASNWYFGAVLGGGVPINGLVDDCRLSGSIRPQPVRRTNVFNGIETIRSDTIKSTAANTANIRLKAAGQQIDTAWFFKATGDSVRFLTGTADTTLNIYSVFVTQKKYSDTLKADSASIPEGRQIRYTHAVRDTSDTVVVREQFANDVGRANTWQESRFAYMGTYTATAYYDTLEYSLDTSRCLSLDSAIIDSIVGADTTAIDTIGPSTDTLVTSGGDSVSLTISACNGDTTARDTFAVGYTLDSLYRDTAISRSLYLDQRHRKRSYGDTLQVDSIKGVDTILNWKSVFRDSLFWDTIIIRRSGSNSLRDGNAQ